MKEKQTMIKIILYWHNELDDIADLLHKKAEEGWELRSKTGIIWGFQKCQPRKVKFNVEVIDAGCNEEEQLKEVVELCAAEGWKHVFNAGTFQIFENEDLNAVPIYTDPSTKLETVKQLSLSSRVFFPTLFLLVLAAKTILQISKSGVQVFSHYPLLSEATSEIILSMFLLVSVADYVLWCKKAEKAVERGETPEYRRTRFSRAVLYGVILSWLANQYGVEFMNLKAEGSSGFVVFWLIILIAVWLFLPKLLIKYKYKKTPNRYETDGIYVIVSGVMLLIAVFSLVMIR